MKIATALKNTLFCIVILMAVQNEAWAVTVSQNELAKMEEQVQKQAMEHKKLQAQATQINMELSSISQEMVQAAKKVQNSEEKISLMENRLEELKTDLKNAEENFLEEDDNLIKTLSALQSLALKPTEALIVQPLTPVDIIRSAMLLRETVPYLEENAERIRKELDIITHKKELVERQYAQISKQKKVLEKEHKRMKALVQKKSQIRKAVEIKSEKAKKNVERLAAQAQDLRDLLKKLEQQRLEKERKEAERRAKEEKLAEEKRLAQQKAEEKQTADLIKLPQKFITDLGKGFAKAKGTLPLPARGQIVVNYGEQLVKGVSSKGITIKTRNQAQVIAPFDGSVIFAGPFRGYGNLIIIEHGDGYLSLLAGLSSMDVELGQMLLAGEPVGQMPAEGDAKLYVEIRKDNQPVNPMAWMKV